LAERELALAPPLAHHADRPFLEINVFDVEAGDLGDACKRV
jgi:hypothetical protein